MRTRNGNVGNGFIDLEKLEPVGCELLAQDRRDLERKPALILPDLANQAQQLRAAQSAGGSAAHGMRFDRLDDVVLVLFAEMPFDGLHGAQSQRFRQVQAQIFGLPTLVIDPLFDHLFVTDDSDARLVNLEGHPGKAFRVELAELIRVIVIIGWTQDHATQPALGDKGVLAFRWLGCGAFGLVKRGEVFL